jgi:glycosyltransferase involved in cell wall biosynthesis
MKISVDGGALNQKNEHRFGTAVFSENLVQALRIYDKKNLYYIYTFENLKPKFFWMKGRISLEEFKENKDVFLALNQALPLYTKAKIISFCHGLSYQYYPQYYSTQHVGRLNKQLNEMIRRSDKIIVSSTKVKDEILLINKSLDKKIVVLPFGIPFDMKNDSGQARMTSFWGFRAKRGGQQNPYFMFVANNQKIKNVDFIIESFIKSKLGNLGYKLYLVGDFKDHENKKIGIISFGNISRHKLGSLYQHAIALLTSSYYESFNFPVLEALSLGCPVVGLSSAIIPELKPYVNVCVEQTEFVKNMKNIGIKPNSNSIRKLRIKFNWKNYVKNLVRLY